jgi:pantothenate kinase type III
VFLGIDWGNSHHQVCVVDRAGQLVEQGKVAHDVAGVRDLQTRLARRDPVVGVAIERSEAC